MRAQHLEQGLEQLKLALDVGPLLDYLALLVKWNKAYNLTAMTDPDEMVTRHLLDSLALAPFIDGQRILDVGSGAGLPGIPLAMAFPGKNVVLIDSNGKKTRFLAEAKRVLSLANVEIVQGRVENYLPPIAFDIVVSRAFSHLSDFIHWTDHLLADTGQWLAMKGQYPEAELQAIQNPFEVVPYRVPGLSEARCCVIMRKI